jgi:sec-independent protein translocase protein TatA
MFGSLGAPELIMIFVVALLVFGPSKLPELGKSLGEAIRGFKKAIDNAEATPTENASSLHDPKDSNRP